MVCVPNKYGVPYFSQTGSRRMTDQSKPQSPPQQDDFARQAEQASPGIVREFCQFLVENKKWWLIPILVAVGLITVLVAVSSSPLAPLIYPLF